MKRVLGMGLAVVMMLSFLIGCGETRDLKTITAKEIVEEMKSDKLPIDKIEMIDKPSNSYSSLLDFTDRRLKVTEKNKFPGGCIGVFYSNELAEKNADMFKSDSEQAPERKRKIAVYKNILLVLDPGFTNDQADEYKKVFLDICKKYDKEK